MQQTNFKCCYILIQRITQHQIECNELGNHKLYQIIFRSNSYPILYYMLTTAIKYIIYLLSFIAVGFYLIFYPYHWRSVSYQDKILTIDRDQYNVAVIHASSMEEYLFSYGTVIAEDRLFQLSLRNRMMQGRLSEDLGEKTLDIDRFMRELNFKDWGQRIADRLQRQNQTFYIKLKAFADGINNRVQNMIVLPLQFYLTGLKWQQFTVSHIFNLNLACAWVLSMNYADQYTRSLLLTNYTKQEIEWLLPNKKETWAFKSVPIVLDEEIPDHLRTSQLKELLQEIYFNPSKISRIIQFDVLSYLPNQAATNTWSIAGKHTESGKPLLANDPHLESVVPHLFYQIKINYTENGKNTLFAGLMPAGALIPIGQSNYFAMGCSIAHGDSQDLYREKVEGNKYLLNGDWKDLKIRKEVIKYKGNGGMKYQEYVVRETHRGPIINYVFSSLGSFKIPEEEDISIVWAHFNEEYESYLQMILLFTIDNLEDLQSYLQMQTKTLYPININIVTADDHILMQQVGLHPIRRHSDSGNYIKDGTTTEHDWIGFVPPQYRMHLKDPEKGFIIHSNNRVAQAEYFGGYLNHTIYTARADRIDELIRAQIASGRKIGMDFARKTLLDTVDVYCRQILPEILSVIEDSKSTHQHFDCNFTTQSYQATMYEVFMYELYHLTKPIVLEKMSLISLHWSQQALFNYIHRGHQGNLTNQQIMRRAWRNMNQHLKKRFETQDITRWAWGQLHKDVSRHPAFGNHPWLKNIFNLEFQDSGNMHTPNMAKMQKLQFSNFQTTQRADYRVIFTFGQDQESQWSAATGTNENLLSGHYSDQWRQFKQGKMIPISFKAETTEQL